MESRARGQESGTGQRSGWPCSVHSVSPGRSSEWVGVKARGGQTLLAFERHLQMAVDSPLRTFQKKRPAWRLPGVALPRSVLTCVCTHVCVSRAKGTL